MERKETASNYTSRSFADSRFDELAPDLSPDERFLAYESNESGAHEIYVQAFPQGGAKRQVSTHGGRQPRWRSDGNELYYVQDGDTLMAVAVTTTPTFSVVGEPKALFDGAGAFAGRGHRYDVDKDGQRFVVVETLNDAGPPVIRIIQNWYEEFRAREQN